MSNLTPFATLVALAEHSLEMSLELPNYENSKSRWVGLGFSLLGSHFVVPMGDVVELMRVPQATRLPGVKHFVLGVANVRGRLMAIIDLAAFFGGQTQPGRSQRRVFVVENEDQYFGFIVDNSLGMQHFASDAFEAAIEVDEMFEPFIKGGYKVGDTSWAVLSLAALAADPCLAKLAR